MFCLFRWRIWAIRFVYRVPCIIGKNGVEEILDLKLNDDEKLKFKNSADSVREMNESLGQNL